VCPPACTHTHTQTLLSPEGSLSLIETNGEITQTAVLNNSLHLLLSGLMVQEWEAGGGLLEPVFGVVGVGHCHQLLGGIGGEEAETQIMLLPTLQRQTHFTTTSMLIDVIKNQFY